MYISSRERELIGILLTSQKEIPIKEIAEKLQVSNRTVHRDLKNIEEILKEFHLTLVKKSGFGVQISGEESGKEQLKRKILQMSHTEYTPEERQMILLITLLESNEPVKLISLANDLYVTVATISYDLDKISERLEKYGLSLIRKRGYGIEIEGPESEKRRIMSDLLLNRFGEYEFLSLIKEDFPMESYENLNAVTEKLIGLVDQRNLLLIEKQIEKMKDKLPSRMADSSYVALIIHLTLAIERIIQGESINFDSQYLEQINGTKEYRTAQKIAELLEKVFEIKIPEEEVGYITMHLLGAKLQDRHGYMLEEASYEVGMKAQELIRFVSEELNVDLMSDYQLFQGLVIHLKPTIYRLQHNMGIANLLLSKIQQDYPDLFSTMEKVVQKVFPDLEIPKEEVGYLVLHFAAAMLRQRKGINALVVCSSGLGTAKILATRLQKEIVDIANIKLTSVFELKDVNTDSFDLIVSTVPLHHFEKTYLVVSPILQDEEIQKIKQFLRNQKVEKPKVPVEDSIIEKSIDVTEKLSSIQKVSETIVGVLNHFFVEQLNVNTIEEALSQACQKLHDQELIQDEKEVFQQLFKREKLGGLGIPETSLALYHARSHKVNRPSFTVYPLKNWLTVSGMDEKEMKINTILLLLAPESSHQEMLLVLSHISSLIIQNEESVYILSSGSYEKIYSFLSIQLEKFFNSQIQRMKE